MTTSAVPRACHATTPTVAAFCADRRSADHWQLCVDALGCCEPAHGQPPDRDGEENHLGRSVEVVYARENAYHETGCEHREGNDCVTKSGRPQTAVPLN